jgi:hypothetical protein
MDESSEPFDEFGHSERSVQDARRGPVASGLRTGLRALSFISLWIAILTVALVIVGHALPPIPVTFPQIPVKSAIPLIAIGFSYTCLVLTLRRTPGQRIVGLSVGLAFILWGAEQFLHDKALIAFIDDVVVFFFVVDLIIVIRHNLRSSAGEKQPGKVNGKRKGSVERGEA